tara:strand:+ start:624 stop:1040 length:417 start_codon:yes stop_codon:yes gene_type:complete
MKKRVLFIVLLGALFACGQTESSQETPKEPTSIDDPAYSGDYEKRYPNGLLRIKGTMKNGKREGSWKYFYDNGMLWSKGYFQNDVQHGPSSVYYPSGVMKMQGEYVEGESVGIWSFWAEDGEFIKKVDVEKEGFPEVD